MWAVERVEWGYEGSYLKEGWEPFAVVEETAENPRNTKTFIYFRKESE